MKIGTFGLNRKHLLGRIIPGDNIVCCTSKDWKIIGVGKVVTPYYMDTKKVFLAEGDFADRFDFKADPFLPTAEIDLLKILDKLSFVKNLAYWAVYFRSAIIEISAKDWQLITNLAKQKSCPQDT